MTLAGQLSKFAPNKDAEGVLFEWSLLEDGREPYSSAQFSQSSCVAGPAGRPEVFRASQERLRDDARISCFDSRVGLDFFGPVL